MMKLSLKVILENLEQETSIPKGFDQLMKILEFFNNKYNQNLLTIFELHSEEYNDLNSLMWKFLKRTDAKTDDEREILNQKMSVLRRKIEEKTLYLRKAQADAQGVELNSAFNIFGGFWELMQRENAVTFLKALSKENPNAFRVLNPLFKEFHEVFQKFLNLEKIEKENRKTFHDMAKKIEKFPSFARQKLNLMEHLSRMVGINKIVRTVLYESNINELNKKYGFNGWDDMHNYLFNSLQAVARIANVFEYHESEFMHQISDLLAEDF